MRVLIPLCLLGSTYANNFYRNSQDGAEYDEFGDRVHKRVDSYRTEEFMDDTSYEKSLPRFRRQNQAYRFQPIPIGNRRLRPVEGNRPLRPVEGNGPLRAVERVDPPAPVFRTNQQQRTLRPVANQYGEAGARYSDIRRSDVQPAQEAYPQRPSLTSQEDLLEGESFQPSYTPYPVPVAAYDAGYVPTEQKSIEDSVAAGAAAYKGETYEEPKRLSFQIHGQDGPNSYRFGYDTGIGYNRQFRYEERDNYGVLHGRYGYYDQEGKLQVVNYTADPETGFHADGEHVPKPQY